MYLITTPWTYLVTINPVKAAQGIITNILTEQNTPSGWLTPEYDDSNWISAKTYGKCNEEFEFYNESNYELKTVFPEKIKKLDNGHFFVDFGRELIAGIELDSPKTPGEAEIRLGEELTTDNRVKYKMRTGNRYQNSWTFSENNDYLANFSLQAFSLCRNHRLGWRLKERKYPRSNRDHAFQRR